LLTVLGFIFNIKMVIITNKFPDPVDSPGTSSQFKDKIYYELNRCCVNRKEAVMTEITRKQVCKCENCGNEAEMVITCRLEDHPAEAPGKTAGAKTDSGKRVRGQAACSHCGNEADIWIEL